MKRYCLMLILLGPASSAHAGILSPSVAGVLSRFHGEPDVWEVQRHAARWVGVDPGRIRSWRRRVRRAAWLPQLRVRVLRGFEDDLLVNANGQTRAVDDDLTIEVRAQWQLDRLLFDRGELFVSREAALLTELRRDAMLDATRTYFERRRVQVSLLAAEGLEAGERLRRALRIQELAARLDALTGGFFGRALRRARTRKGVSR